MRARLPASAQPGLTRAGPARLVPLRLADWRFGECQSHLWPSVFRAGPYGLPCCPQATAWRYTLPARSAKSATPAARYDRRPSIEPNGEDTDRLAGPAPGNKAGAPACCKASRPAQDLVSLFAGNQTARARWDFAPFGAVMKDAPGFQTQGDVIYRAAKTAPAPALQDPRCWRL